MSCGTKEDMPVGTFYVQFGGSLAVYQLPEGPIAMQFTCNGLTPVSDGMGGTFLNGTVEITITEATGTFRSFQGGHNHIVGRLHHLSDGIFAEYCISFITR